MASSRPLYPSTSWMYFFDWPWSRSILQRRATFVVGRDGAGFTAGAQILAGVEAERRGAAHGSGLAPAALLLREVFRAVRLAGVLDDDQVVAGGQLQDRVHVGHLPVQVDREDRRHRTSRALAHHAARLRVRSALGLQVGTQFLGIHRVGARVDVDEVEPCAGLRDRLGGREEGERNRQHGVSGSDARRDQRQSHRVRSAGHSNAKARLADIPRSRARSPGPWGPR